MYKYILCNKDHGGVFFSALYIFGASLNLSIPVIREFLIQQLIHLVVLHFHFYDIWSYCFGWRVTSNYIYGGDLDGAHQKHGVGGIIHESLLFPVVIQWPKGRTKSMQKGDQVSDTTRKY